MKVPGGAVRARAAGVMHTEFFPLFRMAALPASVRGNHNYVSSCVLCMLIILYRGWKGGKRGIHGSRLVVHTPDVEHERGDVDDEFGTRLGDERGTPIGEMR